MSSNRTAALAIALLLCSAPAAAQVPGAPSAAPEAIEVEDGNAGSRSAASGFPSGGADPAAGEGLARVQRRMAAQMRRLNDPAALETARFGVALEQAADGSVTGVQIQGSRLAEFGLQPGDRIVAVDGVRITDAVPLPQLMLSLGENTTKVFEVDRGGATTQVEVPAERVLEIIQELGAVQ